MIGGRRVGDVRQLRQTRAEKGRDPRRSKKWVLDSAWAKSEVQPGDPRRGGEGPRWSQTRAGRNTLPREVKVKQPRSH